MPECFDCETNKYVKHIKERDTEHYRTYHCSRCGRYFQIHKCPKKPKLIIATVIMLPELPNGQTRLANFAKKEESIAIYPLDRRSRKIKIRTKLD
jgi:hypothetical protein